MMVMVALQEMLKCFTNDAVQFAAEVMLSAATREHPTSVTICECVREEYRRLSVHSPQSC